MGSRFRKLSLVLCFYVLTDNEKIIYLIVEVEHSQDDTMLLLSLVHLQLPLQHQILRRRLGLVKKHGVERAGVMNFLRPETLEIL